MARVGEVHIEEDGAENRHLRNTNQRWSLNLTTSFQLNLARNIAVIQSVISGFMNNMSKL